MNSWDVPVDADLIEKTVAALKQNGVESVVVENAADAKIKVLEMIPKGAQVMTMSSVTLEEVGLVEAINESGEYDSVKAVLNKMDRKTQGAEMQKLGAAPDYAVGSVHAITQDGKVLVASNTGSQLPAYASASAHVIWVVGTQKIVASLDEAMKRLEEYVLPLESVRVQKAYGMPSSFISKMLIVNREVVPGRITVVFVKEKLGY